MHALSDSMSPCRGPIQPEQIGVEMSVDALWDHCYPQHDFCNIRYNGATQYVLFRPITSICMINLGIEELVYNQVAGVCLPNDVSYKAYGIFVIPLVFDIVIISLTTFKAYWHVRRESGALVVCIVYYWSISF
jgi:hypothetical protein